MKRLRAPLAPGFKKNAIAGKVNGKVVDVYTPIENDAAIEIVTVESADGLEVYRHSTAHLLAQAIKRIYGGNKVKLGIGPVIEDGFYYDIDMEQSLTPEDLVKIEKEMERIVRENLADSSPRGQPRRSACDFYRAGGSSQAGADS